MSTSGDCAAYGDESFEETTHGGFYLIATAVVPLHLRGELREILRSLRAGHHDRKLHWSDMGDTERSEVAKAVAGMGGIHLVAIGSPVPARRQERARAKCLVALVPELVAFGVRQLYLESRGAALDKRDVTTLRHARHRDNLSTWFGVSHLSGHVEPLLWLADIVAGACRAERLGDRRYRDLLGDLVLDLTVDTEC